jgi:uncharacterized protein YbcV (DUF1398 family)
MESISTSQFARRANRNGTFDSFCRECFATIGITQWKADIEKAEQEHVCDPARLAQVKRLTEK